MKTISLKTLKENLAEYAESAARGEVISVTKYKTPYINLVPSHFLSLHTGTRLEAALSSITDASTEGKYLDVLMEDRYGEG